MTIVWNFIVVCYSMNEDRSAPRCKPIASSLDANDKIQKIVNVRAQVMRWDNSTRLWGQCGGGGMSQVYLLRVLGLLVFKDNQLEDGCDIDTNAGETFKSGKDLEESSLRCLEKKDDVVMVDVVEGGDGGNVIGGVVGGDGRVGNPARDDSYCIQAYRIMDSAMLLDCKITKDLEYNCANNSMLHHWVVGGQKYGLTFQSSSEATIFKEAVLCALAHLKQHDALLKKDVEDVRHLMKPSYTEGYISSINKNFEKTHYELTKDLSSSQDSTKNFDILKKLPYQQQHHHIQQQQHQHLQQSRQHPLHHVQQQQPLPQQQQQQQHQQLPPLHHKVLINENDLDIVPPPRLQTTLASHPPKKPRAITPPSSPLSAKNFSMLSSSPVPPRVHNEYSHKNSPPTYRVEAEIHDGKSSSNAYRLSTLSNVRQPTQHQQHQNNNPVASTMTTTMQGSLSSPTTTSAATTVPYSSSFVAVTSKTSSIANEYIPSPQQRHQVQQKLSNYRSHEQQRLITTSPIFTTASESLFIESYRRGSTLSAGESYVHFTKNNPCMVTTKHDYSYPTLYSVQQNQAGWRKSYSNPRISAIIVPPVSSRPITNASLSSSLPQRHASAPHVLLPKKSKSKGKPGKNTRYKSKFISKGHSSSMTSTLMSSSSLDTSNIVGLTPSAKIKCYYCEEYFNSREFNTTTCRDAPDKHLDRIKKVTCFCCAETAIYHCARTNDGEDDNDSSTCKENTIYTMVCLFVPCFWCYPILKSFHKCATSLGWCRPKHKPV